LATTVEAIISEISSGSGAGASRTAVVDVESGVDLTQDRKENAKIDRNNGAKSDLDNLIFIIRLY
jgi:hypothetical protein